MDAGGTTLLSSPLANFHLEVQGRGAVRMLKFTLKVGEAAIIQSHGIRVVEVEIIPYRHHYRCWLCKYEGVLEFEPDASWPSWTECQHCGLDNEIPPGVHERPGIIQGHVACRMI